jgi:hypothetical protein
MAAVHHRPELLERHLLRLTERDGQVAKQICLQSRDFRFGELRIPRDVGDELRHLPTVLAQHVAADGGGIGPDRDRQRSAHAGGFF